MQTSTSNPRQERVENRTSQSQEHIDIDAEDNIETNEHASVDEENTQNPCDEDEPIDVDTKNNKHPSLIGLNAKYDINKITLLFNGLVSVLDGAIEVVDELVDGEV
ncbi:hypothetical protein E3N88_35981 [Mikania micrantha]|uniref:Uncharacterized protein n=1 Tax=Mikania micrantha TaxID=192012 RepID=A0A5N6M300_9ASTR|nr:hypothetical protein E3N88_35981 [Mikania micrantha]